MEQSRAAADLDAWVRSRGGLRAAARELGIAHNTLARWTSGRQTPRADGELSRAWIEERTGVAAPGWDVAAAAPPPPAPPPRQQPRERVAAPPAPRRAAVRAPAPPPPSTPPAPPTEAPPATPVAPATLEELQRRARQIPGELQQLRMRISSGEFAYTSGEVMARLLEREARALTSAITAAGTATVKEVEQLQALVVDVTSGCETCRDRVTAALRGMSA